jgi:hypothetical protein
VNTLDVARILFPALRRPMVDGLLSIAHSKKDLNNLSIRFRCALRHIIPIVFRSHSGPYLARYDLGDGPDGSHAYAHEFFRHDEDKHLHGHPWDFLAYPFHGYVEERWNGTARVSIEREFGQWYALNARDEYHRISELRTGSDGTSWSLVITAPKAPKQDPTEDAWDFWMPETGERIPWRQFIAAKDLRPASEGNR